MRSPLGTLLAKAPVPYTPRGGRLPMLAGSRNTAESQMRAYGSVGTLFSIVNRTSNATAQVQWKLWRESKSGKKEDRTEVTKHAALDIWRKPNPFYCLAPETRVATEDLRWVQVGSLQVGDRILGFDEESPGGQGDRRRWRPNAVVATGRRLLPSSLVTLADGTQIVASDEHPWLTHRPVNGSYWRKTSELMGMRPGWSHPPAKVVKLLEVWDDPSSYEAGYLAGMYDGEGHIHFRRRKTGMTLGISQKDNEALFEVQSALDRLGFAVKSAAHSTGVNQLTLLGGCPEIMRLLGSVRPKRLLAKWERLGVEHLGCIQRLANVDVVSVEPLGLREVVTLETSTRTLVAEGFAHHNTRQEFVESVQQHIDLTGEGWWVIARNPRFRSVPLELWPVRPDRMGPVPSRDEFIAGYIYRSPDGEQVPLKRDEVIQLRMPSPLDPYRGMGPVQSILTDLDSTQYSAEWNRNFFLNSATPGGIIEVPNNWSDDDFEEFRDRWDEQHRGVAAAHRVGILEGGAKWVERTYSMRDMQFVELREVSSKVIREAFGMPKFAIGDVEDVNRATAEASKTWFAEMLTVPRLERFKQALNEDFLPLFGATTDGLEFDYCDPVPPNAEARDRERASKADAAEKLVRAGYDGESVKEALELPDALVWEKPAEPQPAPPVAVPAPAQPQEPAAPDTTAALLRNLLIRNADDSEELEDSRDDWEIALDQLIEDWQAISAAQRAELHEQIRQAVNSNDTRRLSQLLVTSAEGADLLTAAMKAQAALAAGRMVTAGAEQGVTVEPADTEDGPLAEALAAAAVVVAALLAAWLAGAAGREALRLFTRDADGQDVADRVDEHLRNLPDRPLRDQLGGAIWSAEQMGRFETLEDAPPASYYEATEVNDANRCERCAHIDGTRFDTLAEARKSYPDAGYIHCLGGIRCRGTAEPVWEGP